MSDPNQAQDDEIIELTTVAPAKVADAPQLKFELQQPDPAPTEAALAPKKPAARRRTPPPPVA